MDKHQGKAGHERPAPLDARLVRAHAVGDDADAERRAGVARRQRRSASPRRDRRPDPRAARRCRETVERLVREHRARRRRAVDHDVPAADRAEGHRARARAEARRSRSSSAATTRASRRRSTRTRRSGVDVIVRGEGDITFRELLRALEARRRISTAIAGAVVPAAAARCVRNPGAARQPPDRRRGRARRIAPPACSTGYTLLGRPIDVVETSRGCTYDCSFCSIIEMRGRNFHTWSIDRVIADIADARARGARAIFIVDDNITLNVARFERAVRRDHRRRPQRHRLHRAGR